MKDFMHLIIMPVSCTPRDGAGGGCRPAWPAAGAASGRKTEFHVSHYQARVWHPARAALAEVAGQHLGLLAAQLLAAYGVGRAASEVWAPVVARLATEAAAQLSPSAVTAFGTLDPRFYVKARRLLHAARS